MTSPATIGNLSEPDANSAIADYLNDVGRNWHADAERTQTLEGSGGRPDIVVRQNQRRAVVVETEYGRPAVADAKSRLGENLLGDMRKLTEVIAVGIDEACKRDTRSEFLSRLKRDEAVLSVQLVSTAGVWPDDPLVSRPSDLVAYCEYAQVPQLEIDRHSADVAVRIGGLGEALLSGIRSMTAVGDDMLAELADIVGTDDVEEATRIVCAIWLTMIDLHNDLALNSPTLRSKGLETTMSIRENTIFGILSQQDLIEPWEIIEGVNYVPVIELAKSSLLTAGRSATVSEVLRNLEQLSDRLNDLQAKHVYNFAGELWQRLVTNREERAAHYTKPEVAELLATLAAHRFSDRSVEELASVNLMDAASGTGTLIGAGERALRRLYLMKGGNDPLLHRKRMENHIIALDVDGIAGTLTAKRLTDIEVAQDYHDCRIAVVTHEAGSLCLLNPESTGISDMLGSGGRGMSPDQDTENGTVQVPVGSVDWALMNPPYSRARRGRQQATTGLSALRRTAARYGWKMSHGQAGLGSDFGNMSNIRLKPGGIFAHVLPLTAAHAESWSAWRAELEKDFEDITVIANVGQELDSMSADTAMNEMLVVATKRDAKPDKWESKGILCVNLSRAPETLAQGYAIAREIASLSADDNQGVIDRGSYLKVSSPNPGFPWVAVGNREFETTAVASALMRGAIYDPLRQSEVSLGIESLALSNLAQTGPTHHLIGYPKGGDEIGAFEWHPVDEWQGFPAHLSMWSANGQNHRSIAAKPTHAGLVVDRDEAQRMASFRSHWFISRNLRWTSQGTAIVKTSRDCYGGSTWNGLQSVGDEVGVCLALWFNSIFGAIVRSAYGQSTQPGRARLQVRAIARLPCPDFGADTSAGAHARRVAGLHFAELSELELEPFVYCFRDENRWKIDDVAAEMVGLDPQDRRMRGMLGYYRLMFASEPNVNGRNRAVLRALGEVG